MAILLGTASAQITLDNSQFMAAARQTESAMDQLARAGSNAQPTFFDKLKTSALGLGTALALPIGIGITAAVELEQAIANVNAALGGVDASVLDDLAAGFQELGTASQFSATEVAAVGEGLAKAGFDPSELLNATEAVILLSQATGDGLAPAMDSVVAAMSIWSAETVGLENALTDATQVADIMTIAANNSTASITDINAGMRSLGPVAASMGVGFDEAAAAIALFTNYGLKGADAGISLARGLQNLADPTSEAAALMDDLGIAAFDLEGNFIGFPALFEQLNTAMGDMTDQQQLMALSTIFGAEAMDVMGLAVLNGADPLEALIALMGESGAAAEQSAIRMDTLGAQFDTLKEGITTFLGSLVSGLIPGMRLIVDFANTVVDAMMRIPQPIKTVIGAIASMLALFASINIGIGLFGALSGAMGALGIGAGAAGLALAPVLGIILGITAALGALYLAWRTNFLGMRTRFASFTSGISRFAKSFRDTFRNLTTATYQWGDTVEDIVPTMDKFPAFFIALGNAIGTIGGGLPILGDLGRAIVDFGFSMIHLGEAFDYFQSIGLDPVQAGLRAIGIMFPSLTGLTNQLQITVGLLTEAFRDFAAGDFAAGFAGVGDAIRSTLAAVDIGDVIVNIGSWAAGVIADLWPYVQSWAEAAISGFASAAATVWNVLINIGSWAKGIVSDIWPYIVMWAEDAIGVVSGAASTIWNVLINIGSWAKGIVSDIWPYIRMWAGDAIAGATSAAATLWDVVIDIGSWALGKAVSIESYVALWTQEAWATVSETGQDIGPVLINITSWGQGEIADIAPLTEAIGDRISAAIASVSAADIGQGFVDLATNVINGIASALSNIDAKSVGQAVGTAIAAGLTFAFFIIPAAIVLLGAKLIAEIVKAIADPGNAKKLGAALANLVGSAVDFVIALGAGIFEGMWDGIALALNAVGIEIESTFIGILNGVIRAINQVIDGLNKLPGVSIGHIDLIPTDADQAAQELMDWATGAARDATAEFRRVFAEGNAGPGFIPATGGGEGGGGGGGGGWELDISGFRNQLLNMKRLIAPDIQQVFSGIGPAIESAMSEAQGSVSAGMAALTATMANSAATATTAFGTLFASIGTTVSTAMTAATSAAQAGINGIIAALANGGATATTALTATLAPIPAMVAAVGARSAAAAQVAGIQIATGFGQGAARTPGLVAAALAAVPGIVSSIGGRAAAAAFAVGANIGNAMAAGMRSALGQIQAAASAMVAAAQTALMAAAMISSPSRLFYGLGEYVGEGFELGIRSMIPSAAMAAADLVYVPNVTPGQYAGAASYGGGGGNTYVIDARTVVEGDVTHENDLTARILTKGWEAVRAEAIRHRAAAGVS